jgi:hypothetical protein
MRLWIVASGSGPPICAGLAVVTPPCWKRCSPSSTRIAIKLRGSSGPVFEVAAELLADEPRPDLNGRRVGRFQVLGSLAWAA